MATLDHKVARIVDSAASEKNGLEDEDALFDELEQESEKNASAFRERRLQQLHDEVSRAKLMREQGATGSYEEIKDERTILTITTQCKLSVVHFFKHDFNRCRILDGHLETLAPKHFDTRFVRINVDNCPFLNEKLKIQVLPTLLAFIDGIIVDRVVGFEGIGRGTDSFRTWQLEERLLNAGVLTRAKMDHNSTGSANGSGLRQASKSIANTEDDDDWD